MNDQRPTGSPQNTRAHEVVFQKRRNIDPAELDALPEDFRGWHTRGYLPHRDEPGLTQFVTFRLADSTPPSMRREWEALHEIAEEKERYVALEGFLDRGYGNCALRNPRIAEYIEQTLRLFHPTRYGLRAWAIMPNHVHVLFKVDPKPMSTIVANWKRSTAFRANRILRSNGSFWQADYWDTFMRDGGQEQRARIYIEQNPVKAGLAKDARDWPWSSARFRDEEGVLKL